MSLRNVMNFVDLAKVKSDQRHGRRASGEPKDDAERIAKLQAELDEMRNEHRELQVYFGAALRMLMIRDVFSAKELEEFVDSIRTASAKYANGHTDRKVTAMSEDVDAGATCEAIDEAPLSDVFYQSDDSPGS
ncbi:MAG: hypothetical protein GVY16_08615 [Planctomycetes bacterium]|nr:hypothetical protein [Planctomycetota bacterium]